uniref:Enoyl reductase (ER) domain-containing protein n=1 Tax=Plectus sambesii TaxID=2011161 RepID=A0A914VJD9_9BILA
MKAAQIAAFGGPEQLKLVSNAPVPAINDHQILIRVKAAGVNPVDTYIRQGAYSGNFKLPLILGSDAAGVVEKVGEKVESLKPGDRVFTARSKLAGSYAEFAVAEENAAWLLPEQLTFSQGAAIGIPYFTAYRILFQKMHAKAGETVLVHGASGACGIATVQIARAFGLTVLGTAGSDEGIAAIKAAGVHHAFNHRTEHYKEDIKNVVGAKGVNLIVEMLANVNLQTDIELVAQNGRIGIIGCRGRIEINPVMLMGKEASVVGVLLSVASDEDMNEMGHVFKAGIENGWLRPVVYREYPLEKASEAHKELIATTSAQGKIVLTI